MLDEFYCFSCARWKPVSQMARQQIQRKPKCVRCAERLNDRGRAGTPAATHARERYTEDFLRWAANS